MITLLIIASIIIRITFIFIKHPLSIGLILILQTIIVSLTTGLIINTFWFSYILLITILRGILVLFIYIARVASNEKFYTSIKIIIFIVITTIIIITSSIIIKQRKENLWITIKKIRLNNEQVLRLIKIFNIHNILITLIVISYLFLTIIVISYIVNVFEGPLRTKN